MTMKKVELDKRLGKQITNRLRQSAPAAGRKWPRRLIGGLSVKPIVPPDSYLSLSSCTKASFGSCSSSRRCDRSR